MIRVLLVRDHYHSERIRLVERNLYFQPIEFNNLKRCYSVLENQGMTPCLEAFLESKDGLQGVARKLSDEPIIVVQDDDNMPTFLVDDGMLAYEMGGG